MTRARGYAVVVADINMPGMDGIELLEALKSQSSLVQTIMLTSESTMSRVIECLDRGATDFFAKSDDLGTLIKTVKESIARSERWMRLLSMRASV